jgi:hypothetical protein
MRREEGGDRDVQTAPVFEKLSNLKQNKRVRGRASVWEG